MLRSGIQLSVVASALGSEVPAIAQSARQAGIRGLQFDAVSSTLDLTQLSMSGRREFLRFLSQQERQFVGLRLSAGDRGVGKGADVDHVVDRLSKAMAAAVGMQAPLLCVDLGPLPAPPPAPAAPRPSISAELAGALLLPDSSILAPSPSSATAPPAPAADTESMSLVDAALSEIGRHADRYSVVVAFRSELSGMPALERALRSVSCPWFGIDLDPVTLLQDEWPLDEVFSRIGHHIRHVRGRDALAGAQRRTRPAILGRGSVDWPALLAALEQTGYNGWLTIDALELTDRRVATLSACKYLQTLSFFQK